MASLLDLEKKLSNLFNSNAKAVQNNIITPFQNNVTRPLQNNINNFINQPRPQHVLQTRPPVQQARQPIKVQQFNPVQGIQSAIKPFQIQIGQNLQKVPDFTSFLPQDRRPTFDPNRQLQEMVLNTPSYAARSAGNLLVKGAKKELTKDLLGTGIDVANVAGVLPVGAVGRLAGKGATFSKAQIELAKNFTPEVRALIGNFAETIERGKRIKQNTPEADYVYSLAETVFGKQAAHLNPKQLKNAFDALQEQASRVGGKPQFNIGLSTKNIREGKPAAQAGLYDVKNPNKLFATEIGSVSPENLAKGIDQMGQPLERINTPQMVTDALSGRQGKIVNGKLTVYRVVPEGKGINAGDLVFDNPKDAQSFLEKYGRDRGQTKIVSTQASLDELSAFKNSSGQIAKGEIIYTPKGVKVLNQPQNLNVEGKTSRPIGSRVAQPTLSEAKPIEGASKPFVKLLGNERPRVKSQAAIRASTSQTFPKSKLQSPLEEISIKSKTTPRGQSFDDIINRSDINVKNKVNLLDYLRTPDRVLSKMGLSKESDLIRKKYDDYLTELPKEIEKVTQWSKQVSPEANQRIFRYLDGTGTLTDKTELKVANEIKDYLKTWADRLKLPEEKRITNYITHIFDKDFIQKEFDPEIAALIRDRVPGSVYDPFVEQRLGKAGYIEDTWRALDAYVKRATRKANMDEALEQVSQKASQLEESQFNYVKKYIDKVNMRPGQIDNLIDNTVKSVIGYKLGQRPMANVSRTLRQMVYRGTLGLNVGSALRNLTQGANTYAKLGEKYTAVGYYRLAKEIATRGDELERVGVLRDNFIQDRTISATGKFWENLDKGLWAFFQAAEKVNRGAAYFGAKAMALSKGLNEQQAIEAGKNMVRDTQFTFGSVDTPQILQSDIAKTLLQFQSYNLKQAEFLTEMAKSKDFAGLTRFGIASTAMLYTIGSLIGMKPTDFIPFYGVVTGQTKLGETPPVKIVKDIGETLVNARDQFGQEQDMEDRLRTLGNDLIPFIPGGVQIKKTIGGLSDTNRGYAETRSGNVKFPVGQDMVTKIRAGIFGTNNLPEGQEYYRNKEKSLSENQSEVFKSANPLERSVIYKTIMAARDQKNAEDKLKEQVMQGGSVTSDNKVIFNDNGEIKTIDLSPPTKGSGIDAFTNQSWKYTKAREIWKHRESIPQDQVDSALAQLGVDKQEAEYDYKARHTNDQKTQYIVSKASAMDHNTLIDELVKGRVESVSGTQFASNGVLDNLYEQGIISYDERKALKALKLDKNGKSLVKTSGKTKKGKAVTIKKVSSPRITFKGFNSKGKVTLPKLTKAPIKTSTGKQKTIRIAVPKGKVSYKIVGPSKFRNDLDRGIRLA